MSTVQDAPATASRVDEPATLVPENASPHWIDATTFGRMLDAEVFPEGARVELWDGRIYEKMAKTQAHTVSGNKTNRVLTRTLRTGWFVGNENPVTINQQRVPLPDLVILRGEPDDYNGRRPSPADVGLIAEFSVTSLKSDTGFRLVGYAEANIPVYWVLNLIDNVVLVFERPVAVEGRYELAHTYSVGQSVPLRLDGVLVAEIPALDLLPVRG